jgi:hypothetical protein
MDLRERKFLLFRREEVLVVCALAELSTACKHVLSFGKELILHIINLSLSRSFFGSLSFPVLRSNWQAATPASGLVWCFRPPREQRREINCDIGILSDH